MNNKQKIAKYQEELSSRRTMLLLEEDALRYALESALGKSIYNDTQKRREAANIIEGKIVESEESEEIEEIKPKKREKKAKYSDRIECLVCGKVFTRSNRTQHNNSKYHITFEGMNKKLRSILMN